MILDPKLTGQLPEVVAEGGYYGMQTFDQHLLKHLQAGRITYEEAMRAATSPHDFKLMVAAEGPLAQPPAPEAAEPAPEPAEATHVPATHVPATAPPMQATISPSSPPPPSAPPPGVRY